MNDYPEIDQRLYQTLSQISLKKTKNKNRILFFDRDAFADNTKYLYLHMLQNPQFECVWCTWNDDVYTMLSKYHLPVHFMGKSNDETINLLLETGTAVFCVNPHHSLHKNWYYYACLQGAKHIQLWHGVSVKKLLLQLSSYFNLSDLNFSTSLAWASRANMVLSTHAKLDDYWREVFGCDNIINAGYPRNEVLVRPPSPLECLGSQLNARTRQAMASNRKKILLAPTWQRFTSTDLLSTEVLSKLFYYSHKNNIDVFIKTHPYQITSFSQNSLKINNFFFIDANTDVYPYLNKFDLLITDYSSIMFDFLLVNRPILTLDILPGAHADFEPDYSLLPTSDDFRHKFNSDNFIDVLHLALHKDEKSSVRASAAETLFPADNTTASTTLAQCILNLR